MNFFELLRSSLAAWISRAFGIEATLIDLGCIDAVEAKGLAIEFDGVGVASSRIGERDDKECDDHDDAHDSLCPVNSDATSCSSQLSRRKASTI
jgi:hypothetical protein